MGGGGMKGITIALLLLVSVGCFEPAQVKAEAPKPRGGCWSKDIVMRSIEDPQTLTTVTGRVVKIEYNNQNQQLAAKEIVMWVKLQTADGKEQSIYLGSNKYLNQQRLKIKLSDLIEIQGVQTITAKQLPTIVATTIKKGERIWKTNNISAKPIAAKWCKYSG
jgi:hypothetical protein